jgi:hypothetical protein
MQDALAPQESEIFMADFIEKTREELTRNWLRIVRNHQLTRSYGAFDEEKLFEREANIYLQLSRWLRREITKDDLETMFTNQGATRRREGFYLAEVVRALIVTRRVLWFMLQAEGMPDKVLDAQVALDLNNRVVLFFDRALYFTTVGFEKQ